MNRGMCRAAALCAVMLMCLITNAARAIAPDDAGGFVVLSDYVPDIIQEIRYFSTYNFVGERIDGYDEPVALLTREAALALREVSQELGEKGYRLKIFDAYRPQMAVDHFVRWARDASDVQMKAFFYPELNKDELFRGRYISSHSGHSRGSTVDLTLFDMNTGREVDMGGTFDYFGKLSHPGYSGITEEQRVNRMLLRDAMVAHGFQPISTEWWHFTLAGEPYPNTSFTFPVCVDAIVRQTGGLRLEKGMRGENVLRCQEQLIRAGFLTGDADGIFGQMTKAAVMAMQEQCGLVPTGIYTGAEEEMINAIINNALEIAP